MRVREVADPKCRWAGARRMVESAGFDPVVVSWVPMAGDHKFVGAVLRLLGGDEMDVVVGHKPAAAANLAAE